MLLLLIIAFGIIGTQAEEEKSGTGIKTPEEQPVYNPAGKRDPFKPFIKIIEKKEVESQISKSLPPIKRYPLEQFRLVGIVWVGKQAKAMIVDPEKNTYILGVGDEIGNKQGKIVEVRDNGIMIEEKRYFENALGEKKVETSTSVLAFKEE